MSLYHRFLRRIKNRVTEAYYRCLELRYGLPEVEVDTIDPGYNLVSDQINLPSRFRPEFDHDDLIPLLNLIKKRNPKVVLEFGTAHGNTVANICLNHDAKVYTVNALPEQIGGKIITFTLNKDEIGEVYKNMGLEDQVVQIYANTRDISLDSYLQNEKIDFAIIDACHDIDFVVNDFYKILPHLEENAFVLFHDTHPSQIGHLKCSYRACLLLRGRGYNIRYCKDTWWGKYIHESDA